MTDTVLGAGQESPHPAEGGQSTATDPNLDTGAAGEGEGEGGGPSDKQGSQDTGGEGTTGQEGGGEGSGEGSKSEGEGAGEDGGEESTEGEGAPEQYEPFELPEGLEIDEARNEQFVEFAKSHNLSQEAAQQAVDMAAELVQATQQQLQDAHQQQVETWAQQAFQDEEIGGNAWDANVEAARSAIERFGGDGLKQALEQTGLGNHPELIRFAARVGKQISEDNIPPGGGSGDGPKDPADILYGSS